MMMVMVIIIMMMMIVTMNLPVACSFQRKSRRYVDSVWNHDDDLGDDDDGDNHDDDDDDDDNDNEGCDDYDSDDDDDEDDDDEGHLVAVNHEGEGEWDHNSNHLINGTTFDLNFVVIQFEFEWYNMHNPKIYINIKYWWSYMIPCAKSFILMYRWSKPPTIHIPKELNKFCSKPKPTKVNT